MVLTIWIKDFLFPSSVGSNSCKLLVSIYLAFAQYFVILYGEGWFSPSPPQNKLICFSYAVLLFVVEWRQNILFLTSELANKAEIYILSAREQQGPGFQAGASWLTM